MTIAEVCRAAADYLRDHGWCQGAMKRGDRRCLVGAIWAVVPVAVLDESPVYLALLDEAGMEPDDTLSAWNDAPGRLKRDVIDLLERTASKHEVRL